VTRSKPTGETIRAGDLDVYYTEAGDGPPVILVHGGLATASIMWNPETIAPLVAKYRVLMPDSRAHGRTNDPLQTLTYPQMADDVVAFATALGLEKPIVIGYSDGAQIGIELGLRHPGVARALVLGGAVISTSPAYFDVLTGMGMSGPGVVDLDAMRASFGDELFEMMVVNAHADWQTFVKRIATLWWNVPTYTDEQLATIADPCLVICGDRDRAALDDAPRLFRALRTAELAVVPDSEHGAASKPMFWTNVLDFLERH
jgi:pimeloyl-ACP methyl ester carboxylesterase